MDIRNNFEVPLPPAEAWAVLLDIPRIAPCMPGAKLVSVDGDGAYSGEVQVRLGPVMLAFRGQARFTARDDASHTATVHAEGRDQKGRGGASADVKFTLVGIPAGTRVEIETSLSLSGSVAQYGRGAGMIADLANLLIGQFAANLRKEIAASAGTAVPAAAPPPAAPAPRPQPVAQEAAPIQGFRLGLQLLWRQFLRLFGLRMHRL